MASIPTRRKKRNWIVRVLLTEQAQVVLTAAAPVLGAAGTLIAVIWVGSDPTGDLSDIVNKYASTVAADDPLVASARKGIAKLGFLGTGAWVALGLFVIAFVAFITKFVKTREKEVAKEHSDDPFHLLGTLHLLHSHVASSKAIGSTLEQRKRFRVTVHTFRKEGRTEGHEQCIPYVGYTEEEEERAGRWWDNRCGLVGRLAREDVKDPILARMGEDIQTPEDYWRELVKLYGYTKQQAKDHEPMRLSSLVIPIRDETVPNGGKLIGAVYCDSSEREFFDPATSNMCVYAAMALAKQVQRTNPK